MAEASDDVRLQKRVFSSMAGPSDATFGSETTPDPEQMELARLDLVAAAPCNGVLDDRDREYGLGAGTDICIIEFV